MSNRFNLRATSNLMEQIDAPLSVSKSSRQARFIRQKKLEEDDDNDVAPRNLVKEDDYDENDFDFKFQFADEESDTPSKYDVKNKFRKRISSANNDNNIVFSTPRSVRSKKANTIELGMDEFTTKFQFADEEDSDSNEGKIKPIIYSERKENGSKKKKVIDSLSESEQRGSLRKSQSGIHLKKDGSASKFFADKTKIESEVYQQDDFDDFIADDDEEIEYVESDEADDEPKVPFRSETADHYAVDSAFRDKSEENSKLEPSMYGLKDVDKIKTYIASYFNDCIVQNGNKMSESSSLFRAIRMKVDQKLRDLLESCVSGAWTQDFISALKDFPIWTNINVEQENNTCEACNRERRLSYRIKLSSLIPTSLSLLQGFPEYSFCEFNVGKYCFVRAWLYHSLLHFKLRLILAVKFCLSQDSESDFANVDITETYSDFFTEWIERYCNLLDICSDLNGSLNVNSWGSSDSVVGIMLEKLELLMPVTEFEGLFNAQYI